jgi:hypothetical protein
MKKHLCFLVLALLLMGHSSFGQGFTVCGSKIYDPSGKEFIVKGTNVGGPGWNWPERTLDNFDHVVKWKFNTIRLVLKGAPTLDSQTTFSCAKTGWPEYQYTTFGTVRQIVKKYTDAKIVVLLDWQEVGGIYTGSSLECAKSWWTMLANEYKGNPYVWFDMYNEPNTDKASWAASFQAIINAIRGTGNTSPIIASGNYWGQDSNSWSCNTVSDANSAILTSTLNDPTGNLVYSIHTYDQWMQCQSKLDNYLDRVLAQGKAILIGEYGIHNKNPVIPAEDYTLAATQARKIGRIQWAFWGGDSNDMTTGGNGGAQNCVYDSNGNCTNLSTFGQKVWNDARRNESLGTKPSGCGATSPPPPASGSNLIKNHSFESNLSDWTVTSGTVAIDGSNAQDGSKAVKVGSTDWSWVQQTVSGWSAGSTYTFSAWGKAAASGSALRVAIKTSAGELRQFDFTSTSYTQQTASVTIPSTATWVQVYVTNRTSGTGYADNISLAAGTTPAAPSGLSAATVSSSQINLSWTDNASNESGFRIERKTGSGGSWSQIATVGANATSYQNTGLTAATTYYYRLRAYNSSGNSSYSGEASATTQSSSSGGTNLIKNHSFESNLNDWTVTGGTVVIDGNNAQDGSKAVKVGSANWSWVQQTLSGWTAGSTYSFSAWGKAAASGNAVRVALKTNAGDLHTLDFTSTSYTQQTATVTLPSGTSWVQVYVTNRTSGTGYADNIRLVSTSGARLTDKESAQQEESLPDGPLQVYPNPSKGRLSVLYEAPAAQTVELRLLNLQGQVLQHTRLVAEQGHNSYELDVANAKAGFYILQLFSPDAPKPLSLKVLVEK